MIAYSVSELWRYPVKGLAGEKLQTAAVSRTGLALDRRWRLVDGQTGDRLRSKDTEPALSVIARGVDQSETPLAELHFPDGRILPTDHDAVNDALSDHFDRPVALEEAAPDAAYWYDTPLHILSEASLRWLAARLPNSNPDVRRFRPNILLRDTGNEGGQPEIGWVGCRISIGAVEARGEKECERCIITTRAQPGLSRDPAILQTLIRESGQNLGLLASITQEGTLTLGDQVAVG